MTPSDSYTGMSERARIVAWLRARALVWRNAVLPAPRDNILVADTIDGVANEIERGAAIVGALTCDQCGARRAASQDPWDNRCPNHALPEPYSSCDGTLRTEPDGRRRQ